MKPKIVFFGSDQYSAIVWQALQEDKRFRVFRYPKGPKKTPDVGVLASYGQILPKKTLVWPKHGILNIHPSFLPKYRGPTPAPTAILQGEKTTGVSIIKMDEKVDHGPIVAQRKEKIKPDENAEKLLKRLFTNGVKLMLKILPDYLEGKITPRPQNHAQATNTQKFTRQDGVINWSRADAQINRHIKAMHPWPGAWTQVRLKLNQSPRRLKILAAHLKNNKLVLDKVQLEGKKPVTYKQFREGYPAAKVIS